MKYLMFDGNNYIWKKGNPDKNLECFVDSETGECTHINNIVKVLPGKQKNHVICKSCGAYISKDKWEDHCNKSEKDMNCMRCDRLGENNKTVIKVSSLKVNDDGTYTKNEKIKFVPYCRYTYTSCADAKERLRCRYQQCRSKGYHDLSETLLLLKYPKLNDTLITESKLVNNKWKLYYMGSSGRIYIKNKLNLRAYVNSCGIVKCFAHACRSHKIEFKYSKEYDIFFIGNKDDVMTRYIYGFNSDTISKVKEEVRKLYKEA